GVLDQLLPGYITQAKIKHARGNLAETMQTLDEAMRVAMARKLERLRLAVVAERVKLLVQDGASDQAARFARSAGIPRSPESLFPKGSVASRDELFALAWFRVALSEGRTSEVVSVGKHWRSFCAAKGAIRSLVGWNILLAHALFIGGELRAAQRALREAITHA